MKQYTLLFLIVTSLSIALSQSSLTYTQFANDTLYYVLPGQEKYLESDIDDMLLDPSLLNANVGISVYSITKREYLYRKNSNKNYVPASLNKLFTTFSSLFYLGSEYKYSTEFYYRGYLSDNGILDGDLIVFSNGDPTLSNHITSDSYSLFNSLINSLDSIGIRKITGNIIGDVSYFDNQHFPDGWQLNDLIYDFSAPISVFNYHNNTSKATIISNNEIDEKALIEIYPESSFIDIENDISTIKGNSMSSIEIERANYGNNYRFSGYISVNPNNYEIKKEFSISNPELYYLNGLKEVILESEIEFGGGIILKQIDDPAIDYNECVLLMDNKSINLIDIIKIINQKSDNLLAETLVKTIAKEKTGIGSFENGMGQIRKLSDDIGINSKLISLADGSGLSRMNLLSPTSVTKLLTYINKNTNYESFYSTLPKPGVGTLESRMKNSLAENNLRAKTGSMNNISNIAGFVKTEDGELLAFCIMINNFTSPINSIRNIQDLICMRLSAFTREFKIKKDLLKDFPEKTISPNKKD
ncbi:D-alanyl-D-alanine carboxypeptidase/D-alanyl-D-alanine-endopeptidase [Candidatus Kapabacteria bacterium]|nr:D-alanyl-D-alanine carboxypeptidase/D-alanyl-D-alanine-endopeptidase [Candidatus Kapabacteria bacterium]